MSEDLLQDADEAMYQAKRKGGGRHQLIDFREQHLTADRHTLERDLRHAVERDELRVVYQPIVATHDGRLLGLEVLLRWHHPTRGLVPPALFIPLAEQSGIIATAGRWVLQQACAQRARWNERRQIGRLTMSVNVSAHEIMAAEFAASTAAVLARTGTPPEAVTLEVTEGVFLHDGERALTVLHDLKDLGVNLALDDFGTGYSSLTYLQRFPLDIVKIDQSFVAEIDRTPSSRPIITSVVNLAHVLDMSVVAEGVETSEQRRYLDGSACDACQGYFFARPTPAAEIDLLLDRSSPGSVHLRGASAPRPSPGPT